MANRKVIDRGMIEEFGTSLQNDKVQEICYVLSDHIDDITYELSQTNNLFNVQNVNLTPAGDHFNNTAINNSELNFYLVVRSAQLELNSVGPMEKRLSVFWQKLKTAWQNRNRGSRRLQKKQKKLEKQNKKMITEQQLLEKKEKPYTIKDFKSEYFDKLAERLANTTLLYNDPSRIRILARDEFGFRINIYPAIKHDDWLKVWDPVKYKFITTKPQEAKDLLNEKAEEIAKLNKGNSEILFSIIRVFKNLFYNTKQSYNYEFVESIIYNCPNSLFVQNSKKSIHDVFIKILNYINNHGISNIRSIYNADQNIYQQSNISYLFIKSFFKDLDDYLI